MPFSSYCVNFSIATGPQFEERATGSNSYTVLQWGGDGWASAGITKFSNSSGNAVAQGTTNNGAGIFGSITAGNTNSAFRAVRSATGSTVHRVSFVGIGPAAGRAYSSSAMKAELINLASSPWKQYRVTVQSGASTYDYNVPGSFAPTINNGSYAYTIGTNGAAQVLGIIEKFATTSYFQTYAGVHATTGTQAFGPGIAPATSTAQFKGIFTTIVPYDFSFSDNQTNITKTIAFSYFRHTSDRFSTASPVLVVVTGTRASESFTLGHLGMRTASACGVITARTTHQVTHSTISTGWTWNETTQQVYGVIRTVVAKHELSSNGLVGYFATQTAQLNELVAATFTRSSSAELWTTGSGTTPHVVVASHRNTRLHLTTRTSLGIAGTLTYSKTYLARTTSSHIEFGVGNSTTLLTGSNFGETKTIYPFTVDLLNLLTPAAVGTFSPRVAGAGDPPYFIEQQGGFENFFSQKALTGNFVNHVTDQTAFHAFHGAGALYTFSALANRLPGSPSFFDFGDCSAELASYPVSTDPNAINSLAVTIVQRATKRGTSTLISQNIKNSRTAWTRTLTVYYENSVGTFSLGPDAVRDDPGGAGLLGPTVPLVADMVYNTVGKAGGASYRADGNYFKSNESSFASVQGVYSHPISLELSYTDSHLASSTVIRGGSSFYSTVKNLIMQTFY